LIGVATAVAAVVASVVVVASVSGGGRANHSELPAGSPGPGLIGIVWALTQVRGATGSIDLVADHPTYVGTGPDDAWIYLDPNGRYISNDTVNTSDGSYMRTTNGLDFRYNSTGLAGVSQNTWHAEVGAAMAAITVGEHQVTVEGAPAQLILKSGDYTLFFKNAGPPTSDFPVPAPS
jgi:hypothetical protein